jgi:hypothetical protein
MNRHQMSKSRMYQIKLLAAIVALSCCTLTARAGLIDDQVDKVLGFLGNQGAGVLCRKGDAKAGIFSLRSFEGNLCQTAYIAAISRPSTSADKRETVFMEPSTRFRLSSMV